MTSHTTSAPSGNKPAQNRSRIDDPLLASLITACQILHQPHSAEALVAGLPLVNQRLTPDLFVRAARRAGLAASIVQRPLTGISNLVLPAVLLLRDGQACIMTRRRGDSAEVVLGETGGNRSILLSELDALYTGEAIFIQTSFRFDRRTEEVFAQRPTHWFWDVLWQFRAIYGEVLVASLLINLFALASPLFLMNVYDRVVTNHAVETLWVLSIGMGVVALFDFAMKTLRGYFIDAAGKRADLILSSTIFERVMGIRMEGRPESVGAFANNLHEFEFFRDFLTSATLAVVIDLPFLFLFILVIASIGGWMALIPLVVVPLGIAIALSAQGPLKAAISQLFRHSAQKGATLIESLSGLESLKVLGAEGQMQRRWEQTIGNIADLGLKTRFLSSNVVNAIAFLQQIAYVSVVIYGVYLIADKELTTGGLIACTILTSRALAPLGQVAALLTRYHQARASLQSMNSLMNLPGERDRESSFVHRPHFSGAIEFKNVTFCYPGSEMKSLDNLSFSVRAGEHVAIIGRIGSGKTTIEKLIMGLYQPKEGAVLIDGTDLRQIDPVDLRRNIGYVPQDVHLFYGSVKDNIVMGAAWVEDAAILRAADISGVNAFVNAHPLGFDLPVGERGAALSGGQRQSITVARAVLLDPPIYLMDEPTNAMDNSTEEAIKTRLSQLLEGKTLLVVTHRASLLNLVDRLIVVDHGRIVADGPKDSVLEALKKGQIKVAAN